MRTLALWSTLTLVGCSATSIEPAVRPESPTSRPEASWVSLFDPAFFSDWQPIIYGGEGEARLDGDELHLPMGNPLTGSVFRGDLASLLPDSQDGYQLSFEAKRVEGGDFFCGATFPVGRNGRVTLILGGWGGGLVGLSSLDDLDASQNETTTYQRFERDRWYDINVKVTPTHIECRIDGKRVANVARARYRKFSVRIEVEPSLPLGFSTFSTYGVIRDPRVRALP